MNKRRRGRFISEWVKKKCNIEKWKRRSKNYKLYQNIGAGEYRRLKRDWVKEEDSLLQEDKFDV